MYAGSGDVCCVSVGYCAILYLLRDASCWRVSACLSHGTPSLPECLHSFPVPNSVFRKVKMIAMADNKYEQTNVLQILAMIMFLLAFISHISTDAVNGRDIYGGSVHYSYKAQSDYPTSDMFYVGDDLYLLTAGDDSLYSGFRWDGSAWQSDLDIVQGLNIRD